MKLHPRVTRTGVELVKRFEGLRRRAARLPDGGWTIGYGHTLTAREGAEVTPEDAEALLYYDLSEVAGRLEAWTFTPLNQNQFEALSAFAFNIGLENFRNSTVLTRVNEGQHLLAAAAMELWRKADFNGEAVVVDALVRRRAAEKAHYLTPPEGFRPAPSPVLRPTFDHSVIDAAAQAQAARNAAVVDVPLDGETAVAFVESAPDAAPDAESLSATQAELIAQTPAYEATSDSREAVQEEPVAASQAVNDAHGFAAPRFFEPPAREGFRGFEPPPRRFDLDTAAGFLAPPPANAPHPALAEPEAAVETVAEATSDFTLFDQPLAPPTPAGPAMPMQGVRSMRLAADGEVEDVSKPVVVNGVEPAASGLLRNRVILYASIGVLGVFLFSIAVGNMAFGKASSATLGTLFMGILGIALMTPAGVWFLMRRANTATHDAEV